MHGYWEWFRKDGSKSRSGHFDTGKQVGEWITYDRNGQPVKTTSFDHPSPKGYGVASKKQYKESEVGMDPVVHFEMPAKDKQRVAKFYTDVFDWKMTQLGNEMGDYLLATTSPMDEQNMHKNKGAINGGFFSPSDTSNPYPSVVISVDNLEAPMKKVEAAAGTLIDKPMEIPGIGMFISFRDSEGNLVGMLQPVPMPSAEESR